MKKCSDENVDYIKLDGAELLEYCKPKINDKVMADLLRLPLQSWYFNYCCSLTLSLSDHCLQEGLEIDETVEIEIEVHEYLVYLTIFQRFPQSAGAMLDILGSEVLIPSWKELKYFSEICLDLLVNTKPSIYSNDLMCSDKLLTPTIHFLNQLNDLRLLKMTPQSSQIKLYLI